MRKTLMMDYARDFFRCCGIVEIKVQQQPNLATFPNLVDLTHRQLLVDEPNLGKQFTLEAFHYYSASLLWLRILNLKKKFRDELTNVERAILEKTEGFTFVTPEPIRLYLSALGSIETKGGQHLYPSFPPMPNAVVGGTPGYHNQQIDAASHNLYEEIPCLGVIITLIQGTLAQAAAQPDIPVIPEHYGPNANLCFWHRIRRPREEALYPFQSAGITQDQFPNSPAGTGFNFTFLKLMSSLLSTLNTFKNSDVNYNSAPEQGYVCQTIPTHPTAANDATNRATTAEVIPRALNCEAPSAFGMATAFGFQLYKETFEELPQTWCCVTPQADEHPIPPAWINNRNERRNLPPQYDLQTFVGMSNSMEDFLIHAVDKLVVSKR